VGFKELEKLVEYYADKEHPGLRIRPYYQGIVILKGELDFNLVQYQTKKEENFIPDFQLVKN
jgi:rare lipoprotein A